MLPHAVALTSGTGLVIVDYLPIHLQTTASEDGTAVIALDPVPQGYLWLVDAFSVWSTSGGNPVAEVWAGPRRMDGTQAASFDISDRSSPILVAAGESLQVTWTGADSGAICQFDGQYKLVVKG